MKKHSISKRLHFWVVLVFWGIIISTVYTFLYARESSYPIHNVPNTEVRSIYSSNTAKEYELYVYIPDNYRNSGKKYPVVYVLDGQWDFDSVNATTGGLRYDLCFPDAIIVGITYPGENPDYDALRRKDLTPTAIPGVETGGGRNFLSFLKEELVPFINDEYPVTEDRTLVGSSFGGLFVVYTMYEEPHLFKRLLASSPALFWDNTIMFTWLDSFAEKNPALDLHLFLSVGGQEEKYMWRETFKKYVKELRSKRIKGLRITSMIIDGARHSSSKQEAFTRGLRAIFPKPVLSLNRRALKEYAGAYDMTFFGTVPVHATIRCGKKCLLVTTEYYMGKETFKIYPTEKDHFFREDSGGEIYFERNNEGIITGFQIYLNYYEAYKAEKQ